eukprot:6786337-Alexandrium_andersonii.AAC.1
MELGLQQFQWRHQHANHRAAAASRAVGQHLGGTPSSRGDVLDSGGADIARPACRRRCGKEL